MKNRVAIILSLIITCFHGCVPKQDCPPTKPIRFKEVTIVFPLSAWEVHKQQPKAIFQIDIISTDSIMSNTSTVWFLDRGDFPHPMVDTNAFLKEKEVYGITFFLANERNLTDQEMAKKVKKELNLPGEFVLKTKPGRAFYHYQEGCLSIITSLLNDEKGPYPQVSFCYGLKDEELFYYSSGPGHRASD